MRKIGLGLALVAVAMNGCAGEAVRGPGAADAYRTATPSAEAESVPAPVVVAAPPASPPAFADSAMSGGSSSR